MKVISSGLVILALAAGANAQSAGTAISEANALLSASGQNLRIDYAEFLMAGEGGELGRIVFFDSQCGKGKQGPCNRQLGSDWVPGDPRRTGTNNIFVLVDDVDLTINSDPNNTLVPGVDDLAAYHNANQTWEDVDCSNIPIIDLGNSNGIDIGLVQFFVGFGGEPAIRADLTHAGMLSPLFFDAIACGIPGSGCGANILGVTFTLIFVDVAGVPTDIDNNGKNDTGIREIYYNENFPWQDNPNDTTFDGTIDLESVALHEMGHGLSQAHFGQGFFQDRNRDGIVPNAPEEIITTPSAVMNAVHTDAGREVTATDLGGHCSIWANWPSN